MQDEMKCFWTLQEIVPCDSSKGWRISKGLNFGVLEKKKKGGLEKVKLALN